MKGAGAIVALILVALISAACIGGYLYFSQHRRDVAAQGNAVTAGGVVHTQTVAGHDAVQAVQAEANTEAAIHATTQANAADVAATAGAEKPFDPMLYQAALRGHCRRVPSDPACASLRHRGS